LHDPVILGCPFFDGTDGMSVKGEWVEVCNIWTDRIYPIPKSPTIRSLCRIPEVQCASNLNQTMKQQIDDAGWYFVDVVVDPFEVDTRSFGQAGIEGSDTCAQVKYWLEDSMQYDHLHVMRFRMTTMVAKE